MKKIKIKTRKMNKWAFWIFLWFGFLWIPVAMCMSVTASLGWLSVIYFLPVCSNYLMNLFKPDGKTGVGEKVAFVFEGAYLGVRHYWAYGLMIVACMYLWRYGFNTWNIPIMIIAWILPIGIFGLKRNGICYGHI